MRYSKPHKAFAVKFSKTSSHWVRVAVHPSVAAMRKCLRWLGDGNYKKTDAACWQSNHPGDDCLVAELHFARPTLCIEYIVHECSHACWQRTKLQGLIPERVESGNDFQEFLADSTGILTANVLAVLRLNGILVPNFYPGIPWTKRRKASREVSANKDAKETGLNTGKRRKDQHLKAPKIAQNGPTASFQPKKTPK